MRYTITLRTRLGHVYTMQTDNPARAAELATTLAIEESKGDREAWADVKDEQNPTEPWMLVHSLCGHLRDKKGGYIHTESLEVMK